MDRWVLPSVTRPFHILTDVDISCRLKFVRGVKNVASSAFFCVRFTSKIRSAALGLAYKRHTSFVHQFTSRGKFIVVWIRINYCFTSTVLPLHTYNHRPSSPHPSYHHHHHPPFCTHPSTHPRPTTSLHQPFTSPSPPPLHVFTRIHSPSTPAPIR